MTTPKFKPGDDILVVSGDYKGQYGSVISYEEVFDLYMVTLPALSLTGHWAIQANDLEYLPDEEPVEKDDEEEEVDEVDVPAFGMTEDEFVAHMEYLLTRSLGRVATTGPRDAFFGFQEFEGKTPADVMNELLVKLEQGMALLAQTHVLVGRAALALEHFSDQN